MNASPNNPVEIIEVLDSHMDHEVSLVLYGRASLALGFAEPRAECLSTKDVDAIIRFSQLDDIENDLRFWDAVDATNEALAPRGLYITPLRRGTGLSSTGMGAAHRSRAASPHALAPAFSTAHR